uniref:fructose-1,6-bisphosphatase n=1 Tax=Fulvivirga sp. TaxID=1931237 RepID=UPI0040494B07
MANRTTDELRYYQLLAERYPNSAEVGKEIVFLETLLNLPKGSEIFLSDIHGEYEPFLHVLKNGSGIIKNKIKELLGSQLVEKEINQLAAIIYYPQEKLDLILAENFNQAEFYERTLQQMVLVARDFAKIYTTRRINSLLSGTYGELIAELVAERELGADNDYYQQLVQSLIDIDLCKSLIIALAAFIQRLAVHKIHIIGDIYDRGPGAEIIMDKLIEYHSVDIQWGNHDMVWMGAASGSQACIANVLRLSLRYANTDTLEHGYGIRLVQLASFAIEHYKDDKSLIFNPKVGPEDLLNQSEHWLNSIMHKAITIIQFKLEGQLIMRRPEFKLNDRLLLDKIDYSKGVINLNGKTYPLKDTYLPTVDPNDPFKLSEQEAALMTMLTSSFKDSRRLNDHVRFLFEIGGLYKISNNSLLYHGCIPLTEDGDLRDVTIGAITLKGRALLDYLDVTVRNGYFGKVGSEQQLYGLDMMWYLWEGPDSPIFGKDKMATFERYFLMDKDLQKETKSAYYRYRDNPDTCTMILKEFGLTDPDAVILNGHVPVEVKKGESPIKADGKLIVIDGGFSKAYQGQTGIAGYSLIFNSYGRQLIAHDPFESTAKAIAEELDIAYSETILHQSDRRLRVKELDEGEKIRHKIAELRKLLHLFQEGKIKEKEGRYIGK